MDGRCLANLTWALAKLDLSSDDSALTSELALTLAPFIVRSLGTSSPQVSCGWLLVRPRGASAQAEPPCYSGCFSQAVLQQRVVHAFLRAGPGQHALELCQAAGGARICGDSAGEQAIAFAALHCQRSSEGCGML